MITQIKGRLVEKSPTELVIDCNGIGYLLNISLNTTFLLISKFLRAVNAINLLSFLKGITSQTVANKT